MTEAELDAIEARANAATAGPWRVCRNPMREDGVFVGRDIPAKPYPGVRHMDGRPIYPTVPDGASILHHQVSHEDGAFIANARQDVPVLVAEVRRVERMLDRRDRALTALLDATCPVGEKRTVAAQAACLEAIEALGYDGEPREREGGDRGLVSEVREDDARRMTDAERPTGYYWVTFPYPNGARRWEPAGWDSRCSMWSCLGSCDLWLTEQLVAVGPACVEPGQPAAAVLQ